MEGEQSWVSGGNWSYGGYHDPSNWESILKLFPRLSLALVKYVARASDSKADIGYASAHYTSRSFINTSSGEFVYFNLG